MHVAHSPQREVEILHDRLLDLFEQADRDGRPLAPRDVIVMVPDIQTYAPHIEAVFGRLPVGDARHLPWSVADQSARRSAPLIVALAHLLALPESRFAVSDVLDLLDVPALRRRFGLDDGGLPTLRRWIEGAGIRWGLDGAQKLSLGLPALEQNSWRFGLRRMLLGYAVGDGESLDGIAPYAEIGGLDAAQIGPLANLLDQLEAAWKQLDTAATPSQWAERLHALLGNFFDHDDAEDAWRLNRLHDALDAWLEACGEAAFERPLPLAVVREHWLVAIDESRLSQRFLGGAVSFGTLMPMRAIPFRVVCLLGMNDGDYPRRHTPQDFDLMAQPGHARPGDRSRREDDRYLFLEALLSARDAFHLSWVGHSVRDNSALPPSVLVGQLRDYLAAGWYRADEAADAPDAGEHLLDALTTSYPLQPFSRSYFEAGHDPRIFTYARQWQQVHQAPPAVNAPAELEPWLPDAALSLDQLQRFLARPVAFFFNQRLKVHFTESNDEALDDEPFDLDPLQRHDAIRRVFAAALESNTEQSVASAVRRLADEGVLPPGGFGAELAQAIAIQASALAERWEAACARWQPLEAKHELRYRHGELLLEDWLTDLRRDAQGQQRRLELVHGALLDKDDVLRMDKLTHAWAAHLLANACGVPTQTQLIAIDAQPAFAELPREQACAWLDQLLDALCCGMRAPLPLARRTAFAWLGSEGSKREPATVAAACYEGNAFAHVPGERDRDPCLARAWPTFEAMHAAGFEELLQLYRPLGMSLLPTEGVA
jgi:exodeoxyribonuclease V gamma subunit